MGLGFAFSCSSHLFGFLFGYWCFSGLFRFLHVLLLCGFLFNSRSSTLCWFSRSRFRGCSLSTFQLWHIDRFDLLDKHFTGLRWYNFLSILDFLFDLDLFNLLFLDSEFLFR